MSNTVAGVFDSEAQAKQACERLDAIGVPPDAIRIQSGSTSDSADASLRPPEDQTHRRGFFARLFGIGDDEDDSVSHYAEAMRRGNPVLTVRLPDDLLADDVSQALEDAGAIDVNERAEEWKSSGYTPMPTAMRSTSGTEGGTLKAIEETLQVGKRVVQKGRVRVHQSYSETPVHQDVRLREETASIERRPIDRPATEADLQAAFREQEIEIRETSEQPVVAKSARVVEEVSISKKATERTETVSDTVRSTKIDVEDMSDAPVAANAGRYSGVERRSSTAARYSGPERRLMAGRS